MKAAPVIRALGSHDVEQFVVHTGQHYDRAMSEVFFVQLGLPEPDVNLGVGSGTHAQQTAALMTGMEEQLTQRRPALVVVYGDVNSTLAAALVAAKLHIGVAHVEAGLRSFDHQSRGHGVPGARGCRTRRDAPGGQPHDRHPAGQPRAVRSRTRADAARPR
jgi:UDP-N-acetylglucosamine 2-epimerase